MLLIARLRLSHYCDLILHTVFYASEMPFVQSDVATSSPTRGCRRFLVLSSIEYSSARIAFLEQQGCNSNRSSSNTAEEKKVRRRLSMNRFVHRKRKSLLFNMAALSLFVSFTNGAIFLHGGTTKAYASRSGGASPLAGPVTTVRPTQLRPE